MNRLNYEPLIRSAVFFSIGKPRLWGLDFHLSLFPISSLQGICTNLVIVRQRGDFEEAGISFSTKQQAFTFSSHFFHLPKLYIFKERFLMFDVDSIKNLL